MDTRLTSVARKALQAPFKLDDSKLRRIIRVIEEEIQDKEQGVLGLRITAQTKSGRMVSMSSVESLAQLDNSVANPIQSVGVIAEWGQDHCEVYFRRRGLRSRDTPNITIDVSCVEDRDALNLLAKLEEQVERTVQTGIMYRQIDYTLGLSFLAILVAFVAILGALVRADTSTPRLWLTDDDVVELNEVSRSTPDSLSVMFLRRQLHNLAERPERSKLDLDWRWLLPLVPVVVIVGALVYLRRTCYPSAVFLWGDWKDHWETLLSRKRLLWNGVVVAMIISLVTGSALIVIDDLISQ